MSILVGARIMFSRENLFTRYQKWGRGGGISKGEVEHFYRNFAGFAALAIRPNEC